MILEPRNRHILVIPEEAEPDQQEERTVLLPDNYRSPQSPYVAVRVVSAAPDVSQLIISGDVLIVERSMLKEVSFNGSIYNLVLENYILGTLQSEV